MDNGTHALAMDCIYEALVQLMDEKPYEKITVTEIVARAGFSRMAYYRNYSSKDEILVKRLRALLDALAAQAPDTGELEFWEAFFDAITQDETIDRVMSAGLYKELLALHMEFTWRYYEETQGRSRDDPQAAFAVCRTVGNVLGLLLYEFQGGDISPRELALMACASQRQPTAGIVTKASDPFVTIAS